MVKTVKKQTIGFLDTYMSVRKAPVPATKVINPKKKYDRKDNSWKDEDES